MIGSLLGDESRIAMLTALLSGAEESASKLAWVAGVSPQAASSHLTKLVQGGILAVQARGRNRFYRLANPSIATLVEALTAVAPLPASIRSRRVILREARSCYDHIAGRLGVAIYDHLLENQVLIEHDGAVERTALTESWLKELGVAPIRPDSRRAFARKCLDWTERRHHLAGSLGAEILRVFVENKWVRKSEEQPRLLTVTSSGIRALGAMGMAFSLTSGTLPPASA